MSAAAAVDADVDGIRDFDALALYQALDAKRVSEGLSWQGATTAIWELSAELNAERDARDLNNHPISHSTISNIPKRGNTSCQHALFFMRWLQRAPESFLIGAAIEDGTPLPACGSDRRLRWNLKALHADLNQERDMRGLTWAAAAEQIGCHAGQLTGLKNARFATGMGLAMRATQWLARPATEFVYAARW
jgi:hypothetical protein